MKVELHLLQSFAPGNLNRDDTGNPKDCSFGGFRRARISSQSLKRAIRLNPLFSQIVGSSAAIRTRLANKPLVDLLKKYGLDETAAEFLGKDFFNRIVGWDESNNRTKVLIFFSGPELEDISRRLVNLWESELKFIFPEILKSIDKEETDNQKKKSKKEDAHLPESWNKLMDQFKKSLSKREDRPVRGVEVALFGRMLAEEPGLNVEAACQVAHAISTHKLEAEFDYFTAVDDLLENKDNTGAGMIGNIGFNASCFYRYSVVDVDSLDKNLANDKELSNKGIIAFIKSSIHSIPSGKQNTFAAHNKPSFIMVVIRPNDEAPVSMANAFLKPVRMTENESVMEVSVRRFDDHWYALQTMYGMNEQTKVLLCKMKDAGRLNSLEQYEVESESVLFNNLEMILANR